jgi:hypothetical protein
MKNWIGPAIIAAVIVVLPLIAAVVYVDKANLTVPFLFSVVIIVILAAFAAVVLGKMLTNDIDLRYLISEDNGNASLSRFQFLLFTFVIAASYFLFIIGLVTKVDPTTLVAQGKPVPLPDIPSGVLGLIGISGASYVVAKGIQKSADAGSSVVGVNVTIGGTGYTAAPSVTFVGGGGTGAQATAVVAGGVVTGITLTAHGSGYSTAPSVQLSGGGGRDAAAIAQIG